MSNVTIDLESGEIIEPEQLLEDDQVAGGETNEESSDTNGNDESNQDDRGVATSADDSHEGDDDDDAGEGEHGLSDTERDALRERRRNARKFRKQAQKEREETLRRELAARDAAINSMQEKLAAIERRNVGSEVAQLQQAKQQAIQAHNFFKDQIRQATEAGNGAQVAEATERMMQVQKRFEDLTKYEKAMQSQASRPQPLDPRLTNQAQKWMSEHRWYDPAARDQDSRIVMTLDNSLAQEGWDPTTDDYWRELSARVKKYLPHRAGSGKMNTSKPNQKSVVPGTARSSAPSSGKGTVNLSAERVAALKEAGLWDDPAKRLEMIKSYQEFDKTTKG